MIARWLPVGGLALFVGVGVVWRSWLQWRRYGTLGFALFRSGRWLGHARDSASLVLVTLLGAQAIAAAIDPTFLDGIRVIPSHGATTALGALLMLAGTGAMAAAQLDLGASWRIGIEPGARPGLVTGGIYRFCRNPIFLCMLVALLGFLLLLPTTLCLLAVAGTFFGIRQQVREEEQYLQQTYGRQYAAYASNVGRFVPGVGRLRDQTGPHGGAG
jgi:protein-S-isoprenylcysteine O-methyltransferase Ste14